MTKNGLGTLIEPGTLRMERTLPAPIERVWAYFVEPDKRAAWLAGGTTARKRSASPVAGMPTSTCSTTCCTSASPGGSGPATQSSKRPTRPSFRPEPPDPPRRPLPESDGDYRQAGRLALRCGAFADSEARP